VNVLDQKNIPNRYIETYVHDGRIGVLLELRMNDLITTRSESFRQLAKDLGSGAARSS
jgi:hypothetical protein